MSELLARTRSWLQAVALPPSLHLSERHRPNCGNIHRSGGILCRHGDMVSAVATRAWKTRLIGRTREMRTLRTAYEEARAGSAATVIIGGEAGVGKSRLLRSFLDEDFSVTTTVVVGRCLDSGTSPLAYGAFLEILRALPSVGDSRALSAEQLNGSSSQEQLFETMLSIFTSVTKNGPLVVIIEDLHWADHSTRDLLAFLIANMHSDRVQFVMTYRSDELQAGDTFLRYVAQLARTPGAQRFMLERLGREELLVHLDEIAGERIDDDLAQEIWLRSQGNPFFAEELLAAIQDNFDGLPDNVADALLSRVRLMDAETQEVLRLAAVGGIDIDHEALMSASGLSDSELDNALRAAVKAQVLVSHPSGSLEFRHALLREVLEADLMPGERKRAHQRYAEALSARIAKTPGAVSASGVTGNVAALAGHLYACGDFSGALHASLDAAAAAEAAHGYAESHAHFERVVELWKRVPEEELPSGLDLVEVLDQCASVSHLACDNARAAALIRMALGEAIDSDPRRRILRVRLGAYLGADGESREALLEHEAVVRDMSDEPPSSMHAEILCAYAQSLMSAARHRESLRHAEEALRIARLVGDRIYESRALTAVGSNLVVLGQPDLGAEHLHAALKLAEDLGRPAEIAAGYRHLALTLSGPLNRLNEGLETAQKGTKRVSELGLERHWGVSLQAIAIDTLFRLGRWNEGLELVEQALQRSMHGMGAIDLLFARAKLLVGRGDLVAADEDLSMIESLTERSIDLRYSLPLATLRAGVALWQRELDVASSAIDSGLRQLGESDDVWFAAPLVWHAMRVEAERAEMARATFNESAVAQAEARGELFRRLSQKMCASGRQQGALRLVVDAYDVMCEGEFLRIRGEAAPDVWSVVAASWDELGQPYPASYARYRWSEALLARPNGAAKAGQQLRLAYETAISMSAEPLRQDIADLASRARIDLTVLQEPEPTAVIVDLREDAIAQLVVDAGLTKREAQVLELVADGQSNRGIAEVCFISEKTASVHVSNILMKLGVHSRVQAAAVLHRAVASKS